MDAGWTPGERRATPRLPNGPLAGHGWICPIRTGDVDGRAHYSQRVLTKGRRDVGENCDRGGRPVAPGAMRRRAGALALGVMAAVVLLAAACTPTPSGPTTTTTVFTTDPTPPVILNFA